MARTELDGKLADEVRRRVFEDPGFMKVTQVVRRGDGAFRVSLRPVVIKGERRFQGEMTDGGRTQVKNFDAEGAVRGLEEMLAQTGARELHLMTASGDLHLRVTRKGKVLEARSGKMERLVDEQPEHDRVKKQPLNAFDSAALLRALEIADADGRVKPSMRGKFDQVNEFIKVVEAAVAGKPEKTLNIVDCGCGRAYLTLAVYFYLTDVGGFEVRVCGIDRNPEVVATARRLAEDLDVAERVTFIEGDIATSEPPFEPDLVLSLHACDTATDEALARGIEWKCRYLLCAPCCQHELHKTLKEGGPMQAVLRQGILRERLADLLTDTFRAQILRVLGFRVQVMEFVSAEATARNILLRAEFSVKPGQQAAVSDYLELRDFWKVTPWLETRMARLMGKYLSKY
ncbi:MAG: SAM-dependent methyltransferase [Verrucomicrobiota bacterium]|jgi:SAM-dependent methyltransferase|nr:SAM-dependent methyltransferase [Verrucomicrobiota bacterium]